MLLKVLSNKKSKLTAVFLTFAACLYSYSSDENHILKFSTVGFLPIVFCIYMYRIMFNMTKRFLLACCSLVFPNKNHFRSSSHVKSTQISSKSSFTSSRKDLVTLQSHNRCFISSLYLLQNVHFMSAVGSQLLIVFVSKIPLFNFTL